MFGDLPAADGEGIEFASCGSCGYLEVFRMPCKAEGNKKALVWSDVLLEFKLIRSLRSGFRVWLAMTYLRSAALQSVGPVGR